MPDSYSSTPFPGGGGFPGVPSGGFPSSGSGPGVFPQAGPGQMAPGGFPQSPAPRQQAPAPAAGKAPAKGESRATSRKSKADKPEKPVTRRVVSRQFMLAGVFAVAVGGAVTYLYFGGAPDVYVVRATSQVAAGTTVSGSMLEAVALPEDAIEPGTFTAATGAAAIKEATEALDGLVTQFPLSAKAQLHEDAFGLQPTLGQDLAATDRLVSIKATVATSVAGALSVGDHVDIIGAADGWTSAVALNVPIMAITVSEDSYNGVAEQQNADKDVRPGEVLPGDPVPGIYVVKVPAELVPALLNWNESATLNLVYRGKDSVDVVVEDDRLEADAVTATP